MDIGATRHVSTALVIEPDLQSQSGLVKKLTALGHRVVPVASVDQGLDLAQRFHFDLLLCSRNLSGLKWLDFSERVRKLVDAVILLEDPFSPRPTPAAWPSPEKGRLQTAGDHLLHEAEHTR